MPPLTPDVLARLRATLPADQFDALTARVIEGRDYADIATELECSPSVVRKRVSRAVAHLRFARQENR
jgi:RNA polymerase sigma-70 factor (ECF subfamily)